MGASTDAEVSGVDAKVVLWEARKEVAPGWAVAVRVTVVAVTAAVQVAARAAVARAAAVTVAEDSAARAGRAASHEGG